MGGAAAGGALATGTATAQDRVTTRAVIPRAKDFEDHGYDGVFLHIGEKTPGELDPSVIAKCNFESWSPEGITYRSGTLVDRVGENEEAQSEFERVPTTVYMNEASDIKPGTLWVINNIERCPRDYVGLKMENVGTSPGIPTETGTETATVTEDGGAGAFGPGFGAVGVAAAAGIGGALALLRGDGDSDDE